MGTPTPEQLSAQKAFFGALGFTTELYFGDSESPFHAPAGMSFTDEGLQTLIPGKKEEAILSIKTQVGEKIKEALVQDLSRWKTVYDYFGTQYTAESLEGRALEQLNTVMGDDSVAPDAKTAFLNTNFPLLQDGKITDEELAALTDAAQSAQPQPDPVAEEITWLQSYGESVATEMSGDKYLGHWVSDWNGLREYSDALIDQQPANLTWSKDYAGALLNYLSGTADLSFYAFVNPGGTFTGQDSAPVFNKEEYARLLRVFTNPESSPKATDEELEGLYKFSASTTDLTSEERANVIRGIIYQKANQGSGLNLIEQARFLATLQVDGTSTNVAEINAELAKSPPFDDPFFPRLVDYFKDNPNVPAAQKITPAMLEFLMQADALASPDEVVAVNGKSFSTEALASLARQVISGEGAAGGLEYTSAPAKMLLGMEKDSPGLAAAAMKSLPVAEKLAFAKALAEGNTPPVAANLEPYDLVVESYIGTDGKLDLAGLVQMADSSGDPATRDKLLGAARTLIAATPALASVGEVQTFIKAHPDSIRTVLGMFDQNSDEYKTLADTEVAPAQTDANGQTTPAKTAAQLQQEQEEKAKNDAARSELAKQIVAAAGAEMQPDLNPASGNWMEQLTKCIENIMAMFSESKPEERNPEDPITILHALDPRFSATKDEAQLQQEVEKFLEENPDVADRVTQLMKEAADAGRTDYSHYDALAVAIGEHKGRALVQEVEARTATLNVGAFENAVAKNQFVAKAELGSEPGGDAAYFTLTSSTSLSQPLAIGSNQALYEKAGASVKALWDAVNSPSTTEEERLANLKTLVEQLGQNGAKKFTIAGQTFDIVKKENGTHTLEWTYLDQAANTQQRYTLNDLDVANANGAGLFATLTAMNNPQRNLPGRNLPAMTIEFESGAVLDTANVVTTEQLSQTQSVLAALRAEPGDAAAQSIIRNNAFLSESGILTSNPLLKAITPTAIPATTPAAEQGAAQGSDAPEQVKPSEALFNYENGGAELLYSIPISTSEDLERFIASNSGKIEISDLFVLYNRNGISAELKKALEDIKVKPKDGEETTFKVLAGMVERTAQNLVDASASQTPPVTLTLDQARTQIQMDLSDSYTAVTAPASAGSTPDPVALYNQFTKNGSNPVTAQNFGGFVALVATTYSNLSDPTEQHYAALELAYNGTEDQALRNKIAAMTIGSADKVVKFAGMYAQRNPAIAPANNPSDSRVGEGSAIPAVAPIITSTATITDTATITSTNPATTTANAPAANAFFTEYSEYTQNAGAAAPMVAVSGLVAYEGAHGKITTIAQLNAYVASINASKETIPDEEKAILAGRIGNEIQAGSALANFISANFAAPVAAAGQEEQFNILTNGVYNMGSNNNSPTAFVNLPLVNVSSSQMGDLPSTAPVVSKNKEAEQCVPVCS